MAKRPTINTLTNTASPTYLTQLNQNFTNVRNQFDNTLSLDGSTPNAMNADFDLNGNDLINANSVNTATLKIGGQAVVPSTAVNQTVKKEFETVTELLASTLTYTFFAVDDYVRVVEGGFVYRVAASGASDQHVTTAGGVKLYVLPEVGCYNVKAFGAKGDGITNDTTAIQKAIDVAAPVGVSIFVPAATYSFTTLALPQQHGGIELYGEAFNSMSNMQSAIYRGTVLISTQASGNIISCDGGVSYSNRGIRLRNLNIRVSTSGYAIYLKRSPELNQIENVNVYNDNVSGGNGICLESCWVGTRIHACQVSAATIAANNIGINVFNDIKAGGIAIEDTNATGFAKGIRIGAEVYQAALRNSGGEGCKHGFYVDGNDPKVLLDTCHFELNTDIAVYIEKTGGAVITNCTFYRNAESAATKAEIYVASGGLNYNYNLEISNCNFFGLGTNVRAILINNASFCSGIIRNNVITPFGTGTVGLLVPTGDVFNLTVTDNVFNSAATPYSPTEGYKTFNTGLSGNNQIRFAATPVLSADPNTLDDYEEGTWTPILGGAAGQTGQSYSLQQGFYQKIGNRVYFSFKATLTAKGTITDVAVLSGLPFTIGGTEGNGAGYITDFRNLGISVTALSIMPDTNDPQFIFRRATVAAASMGFENGSGLFTDTTTVQGGGWYIVA